VIEGESLVNDATGLLALEFGVAMVVEGKTPTVAAGFLRLTYLIVVGLAVGLLIAFIIQRVERYLDDGPIEIVLSIMIPYTAYLAAQAVNASGVLAVVACGLYLGRRKSQLFSPSVRLQAHGFWNAFTFAINGLVFVLIGLQLPFVLAGIREYSMRSLILYGGAFSLVVIVLRLAWVYPGAYAGYWIRRHIFHQQAQYPSGKAIFVVGWSGMRGVIALAAALALPEVLADGSPFPHRNLIVFLTFCVILVTLVLQGLTLPPLMRLLGLAGAGGVNEEEKKEARRTMVVAALEHIKNARRWLHASSDRRLPGRYLPLQAPSGRHYWRELHRPRHRLRRPGSFRRTLSPASPHRARHRRETTGRRPHQRRSPPPVGTRTRPERNPSGPRDHHLEVARFLPRAPSHL
jgi:NhaP-type Na+/H+ or K+/H+ antiporter